LLLSEDARCCHVAGQGPRQGPRGAVHLRPLLQAEPIHRRNVTDRKSSLYFGPTDERMKLMEQGPAEIWSRILPSVRIRGPVPFEPLDLGFGLKILKILVNSVFRIRGSVLFCPLDPGWKESGLTNKVKANK
jgi:hypothetical protein